MKEKWLLASGRFEAFETRERLLLVGAALAFIYFVWEFTFYNPRAEAKELLEFQQQTVSQNLRRAEAEQTVFASFSGRDPFMALRNELAELQQKVADFDKQLQTLSAGLISPADLPLVLREVLAAKPKVRLLSLETLPAEEIMLREWQDDTRSGTAATALEQDSETPRLYRHGVNIVLESSFAATLDYLRTLEGASWQFYWDTLQYQVKKYPLAQVSVNVYTLSAAGGGLHGAH